MVIAESTITSKRQITIPVAIMKKLNLHPGDSLAFDENNGQVSVLSKKTSNIKDLYLKFSKRTKVRLSDEQLRKARADAWGMRHEVSR